MLQKIRNGLMSKLVSKAKIFARQAHESIDQRRKYTNEPYIVHPAAVAKLVATITDDEGMICAAWLHDVLEDTNVTFHELVKEFGNDIAVLVLELTDISKAEDGNRKIRKQKDFEHTRQASTRAKTVKLANLIDNSRSITEFDPRFAKVYMEEKTKLLSALAEGNSELYSIARKIVDDYHAT